jgi:hypothetical protein
VTGAVIQAVVLGAYLFLCVWRRPFQERFLRIATPVMAVAQIVIVVIVAAMTGRGLPAWIDAVVLAVVGMQSFVALFTLLSALVTWPSESYPQIQAGTFGKAVPLVLTPVRWPIEFTA